MGSVVIDLADLMLVLIGGCIILAVAILVVEGLLSIRP